MKRVLIVDEQNLFRQVLAVVLAQHTELKENLQAGSLAQARQVLAEQLGNTVDLAIVNIDLPQGDATGLIKHLREVGVPVLAFTVQRSLQRRAQALEAGAEEVLTTATSGEQLILMAKRLVGG